MTFILCSSITVIQLESVQQERELFALELGKIVAFDFVSSLASTNINQSAPNLVTMYMYMSIRSQMSLIMGQVIQDQSVLSALEIEKLNFSSLFGIYLNLYCLVLRCVI